MYRYTVIALMAMGLFLHSDFACARESIWIVGPSPGIEMMGESDVSAAMERASERAREAGLEVKFSFYPLNEVSDSSLALLKTRGNKPDLLVFSPQYLKALVAGRMIGPVGSIMREAGIERAARLMAFYTVNRRFYGMPLYGTGALSGYGFVVSRYSVRRGAVGAVTYFLRLLDEEMNRRWPDLVIEGIRPMTRRILEPGRTALVSVRVLNTGVESVEYTLLKASLGREIVAERELFDLTPGESVDIEIRVVVPDPRDSRDPIAIENRLLKVHIDPDDRVLERNEHNNAGQLDLSLFWGSGGSSPDAPKFLGQPFKILVGKDGTTGVMGGHARVASDGTNFLILFGERDPNGPDPFKCSLKFMMLDGSGNQIVAPHLITSAKGKYNNLNLVYGGNQYLATWEREPWFGTTMAGNSRTIIQGARISAAGVLLDSPPLLIENKPVDSVNGAYLQHEEPTAAYTGTEFVVLYRSTLNSQHFVKDHGIFARTVTHSGTVSNETKLASFNPGRAGMHQQRTAFSQNTDTGFLVTESYDPTDNMNLSLSGLWYTVKGGVISPVAYAPLKTYTLTPGSWVNRMEYPDTASDGSGHFFSVWGDNRTQMKNWDDIHGGQTSSLPSSGMTSQALVQGVAEQWPAVEFDGNNYTASYQHTNGCKSYVGLVRASTSGKASSPSWLNSTSANLVYFTDLAFNATTGLVVFNNMNPPAVYNGQHNDDLMGVFINK